LQCNTRLKVGRYPLFPILRVKATLEFEQLLIVDAKLVKRIRSELGIRGLPGPKKRYENLKNAQPTLRMYFFGPSDLASPKELLLEALLLRQVPS
jgi:hypothetical protein